MRRLLVAVLAVLLAGCTAPSVQPTASASAEWGGIWLDQPYQLPDASLTSSATGKAFNLHTGSSAPVLVVYFGYTNCPDVCLGVLANLASARNRLTAAERERLQVLFVTVDPKRDTPAVMAAYLARIDPSFIGLTGPQADVDAVAASMGVGVAGIEPLPNGGYDVNHTAQVVGFDASRAGRIVWTEGTAIGTYRADFEHLLAMQS